MKILVLGSEGFIGSNAAAYFSRQGHDVYTADIVLKEEDHYMVINPEQPDFAGLFTQQVFDVCLNATGAANVQFSFSQPALDFTLNVANVYYLLNALRQYNPHCRFINFSSAAVYGNPAVLPVVSSTPVQPLSPYGWHKLYSEQVCTEFARYFGVPALSLRVFSAYGEGLKKQLFWDLYQKIKKAPGQQVEVFGTGKESRDFIYILDLLKAIECIIPHAAFEGEAINVASGQETTVQEAVETFVSFCRPGMQVVFTGKEKKGDPLNWVADISPLQAMGFSTAHTLKEGLGKTAAWMSTLI